LNSLECFKEDQEIYYHREVLIESPEKRAIHLLTITNRANIHDGQEEIFDPLIFP
jgi:hypothetical protein